MTITPNHDELIEYLTRDALQWESERLQVYDDATGEPLRKGMLLKGNPTIGIGRNLAGKGISLEESRLMCTTDCKSVVWLCSTNFPWFHDLSFNRKRVIAMMVFQMGLMSFMGFKNTIHHIINKNYKSAAREMLRSDWATQTPRRAEYFAYMMEHDERPPR